MEKDNTHTQCIVLVLLSVIIILLFVDVSNDNSDKLDNINYSLLRIENLLNNINNKK